MKLEIGQILYDRNLREHKVSKIGKVYFECEDIHGKFVIETIKKHSPVYSQGSYQLYITSQEVEIMNETQKLSDGIRSFFYNNQYGTLNLPLENLRKIKELLQQ